MGRCNITFLPYFYHTSLLCTIKTEENVCISHAPRPQQTPSLSEPIGTMAHQQQATATAAAAATATGSDLFTTGDAINNLSHHAPSLVSSCALWPVSAGRRLSCPMIDDTSCTCCSSLLFLLKLCTFHYFLIRKPCQAGSVLECPDGHGGSLLIRIQNMAATGESIACFRLI